LIWEQQAEKEAAEAVFCGDSQWMAKTFTFPTASLIRRVPMRVVAWRRSSLAMDTRFGTLRTRRAENENPANHPPAAITAIPGVVFSGTMDGQLLAYSAQTGQNHLGIQFGSRLLSVNGVKANGGSLSNAGPTVVGGMLFTNSGYSHHGGVIPGNVLLAFSVE